MNSEQVNDMLRDMLRRGLAELVAAIKNPDDERSKRFLDAEHAAMVEDYERDFE